MAGQFEYRQTGSRTTWRQWAERTPTSPQARATERTPTSTYPAAPVVPPAEPTQLHHHFVVFKKAVSGSQIAVNNGSVHQHQVIHQVVQAPNVTPDQVRAVADAVGALVVGARTLDPVRQAARELTAELDGPVPDLDRLRRAITRFVAVTVAALDSTGGGRASRTRALANVLRPLLPAASAEGGLHG